MKNITEGTWLPIIERSSVEPKETVIGVGVPVHSEDEIHYHLICDMVLPDGTQEYLEAHANIQADARLIAASKELLRGCSMLLSESTVEDSEGVQTAIMAISKALHVDPSKIKEALMPQFASEEVEQPLEEEKAPAEKEEESNDQVLNGTESKKDEIPAQKNVKGKPKKKEEGNDE